MNFSTEKKSHNKVQAKICVAEFLMLIKKSHLDLSVSLEK